MSLNPLTSVTDYQSMLNRIFWFTTLSALAAVWMLRGAIDDLDLALQKIDFSLEFGGDKLLPIPGGYLLPALGVGLLSRIFPIHGQLAQWLGIRERFDINVIIAELAKRTGIDIDHVPDEDLADHRHEIMGQAFYAFVSGREPQIDQQLVYRALDLWSWFWVSLEAVVVFVATGYVLIAMGLLQYGLTVIGAAIGFAAIGLPLIRSECRRYAIAQVRAITSDPARCEEVRKAFDSIATDVTPLRRAA